MGESTTNGNFQYLLVYQRAMLLMLICVSWYLKILLRGTSIIAVY